MVVIKIRIIDKIVIWKFNLYSFWKKTYFVCKYVENVMVSQGCSEHHEGDSSKFGEEALVDTWEDARRDSKNRQNILLISVLKHVGWNILFYC